MKHQFEVIARSTDVDMIGHVNHAKYLEYLEWARFDWMKELGFTMEEMKRRQLMPVVVHVSIHYRKELLIDEKIRIFSEPTRLGGKSAVLTQRMYDRAGNLACEAEITYVFIDAIKRKSAPIPEEFSAMFEALESKKQKV
ncbi:acyl-CoA thioester hydrolase/thioesterase-3 [Marininema mesophilum]|uniref:Acyl-CoA thioester hydrolase/thioesterase-3 n=1 Tax=Marininema mesophilum TaxID=1048340 RepID=A0A1H2PZI9_9BACL|nr:thioesterase family protein [Marininema mesophilum]SDV99679.1 acyl-CoA thioester hydrolase/thioesterase-3 [Marininema mesophilum]